PALIARNLGDWGHLSNLQGAELVRSVLRRSSRERVGHLVLLHLSEQCNRPELAIHLAPEAVQETGRRILIHAGRQAPAHPKLQIVPHLSASHLGSQAADRPRAPVRRRSPASSSTPLPGLNLELHSSPGTGPRT